MLYDANNGDFKIIVTGDSIINRSMTAFREPGFLKLVDLLHDSDVTVTNAEMLFHNYEDPPSAVAGGTYMRADPELIKDLQFLGVQMVSCANNHAYDFGENGVLTNIKNLEKYDMPHAGTGRTLAEARAPVYLDTARGRVALLSVTSSGPQHQRAGDQWRDGAGRPGANMLRYSTQYTVDRPVFEALRRMSEGLGFEAIEKQYRRDNPSWSGSRGAQLEDTDTRFFLPSLNNEYQYPDPNGNLFLLGDTFQTHNIINEEDREGNLQRIRDARRQADWVIMSMHHHERGKTIDEPCAMVVDFAHDCIDAGGDVFSGHGPHVDQGIEIYKGKPIFYSLAHLIMQSDTVSKAQWENIKSTSLGWEGTVSDFVDARSGREHLGERLDYSAQAFHWRNAFASITFKAGELEEVRLHPIDLGYKQPRSQKGRPVMAEGEVAQAVLDNFKQLSSPFGTQIEIQDNAGVIRTSGAAAPRAVPDSGI